MDVVDHSAPVDEQPQQLTQSGLVIQAADRLWRSSVGDRLRNTKNDRRPHSANLGAEVFLTGFLHLPKCERTRYKTGHDVDDLSRGTRDHLVHPVGDDVTGAGEDSLGVGTASDQSRNAAGFVYRNRLVSLQRILVATDLGDDGVAQPESLVAMLLHIFDFVLSPFGNVDCAHCFEQA